MAVDLGLPNAVGRSCAGCTKCCEGWLPATIRGHDMYEGTPCHFVDIGKGCNEYDKRPEVPCKTFKCLWLIEKEIPEEFKPSLTNVVLFVEEASGVRYIMAKEAGDKMPAEIVVWLMGQAINYNQNVCFQVNGRYHWYGDKFFISVMKNLYGGTNL